MEKCFVFAIFAMLSLISIAETAPSFDGIEDGNFIETPVRYDGAQLWSVSHSDEQTRKLIEDLANKFG